MKEYQQPSRNAITNWWRRIDQTLIFAIIILFSFSLMLVTTSGSAVASRIGLDENYFSSRQILYSLTGGIFLVIFSTLNLKWLKIVCIAGFCFSVIFLILVKFYGYEVKGAVRWMSIYGFSLQPSEFIKPFFAVVTGWLLSLKYEDNFPGFIFCAVLYVLIISLLVIQPDFGMIVVITAVFGTQLFLAGMPLFWIMLAFVSSIFGLTTAYFFFPHVSSRINSFLDPDSNENYQVSKSIAAFENGGMYGKGPGEGSVKQVLPDSHTDFIFAVAGEEFGAIICLIIISVFAFIVIRSLLKFLYEKDKFVQFAGSGIIAQFGFQSIINMGVTLNALPTKGMTLPFISYGGCSTIAISTGMGIVLCLLKRKLTKNKYELQLIEI